MLEMLLFALIMGIGFICTTIAVVCILISFIIDWYEKLKAKISGNKVNEIL